MFGKKKPTPKVRYTSSKLSRVPSTKGAKLAHKRKFRALRRGEPVI